MTVLQRIQREPAKLLAFVTVLLAAAVALGWLDQAGSAIVLGIVAAAIGLLSYFVTPASEVLEQQLPTGDVVQGRAAVRTQHRRDETGATTMEEITAVALILLLFSVLLVVI